MASALTNLVRAFWGVSTFRVAPQDIPASTALMFLTTVLNVLLSVLIYQLRLPLVSSFLVAMLELIVLYGLTCALLYSFSKTVRIVQTMTALMGSGAILGAIVFLMVVAIPVMPLPLRIGILVWNLCIMAHVLRHALNTRFFVGLLVAVGYAFTLNQVVVFVDHLIASAAA